MLPACGIGGGIQKTGERVISCTIIVTDANALTRAIHDRMPLVLDSPDIGLWLSGVAGTELLRHQPSRIASTCGYCPDASTRLEAGMTIRRSSMRWRHDMASLIRPGRQRTIGTCDDRRTGLRIGAGAGRGGGSEYL